jgi:hypothetical protein
MKQEEKSDFTEVFSRFIDRRKEKVEGRFYSSQNVVRTGHPVARYNNIENCIRYKSVSLIIK